MVFIETVALRRLLLQSVPASFPLLGDLEASEHRTMYFPRFYVLASRLQRLLMNLKVV